MGVDSGWRSRLRPASWRGVKFSMVDDEGTFGRRVQVHEYPNRDKPWTEDLGRATRRININAYIIGENYIDQRDKLITAIETAGSGTLVHPTYGEMKGNIDGQVRVTHSTTEGRMCRISFAFVESGELTFPTAGAASGQKLSGDADSLDSAISDMFSSFSLDDVVHFIQDDVISNATAMLNDVANTFQMIDSGVTAAMRLMQGDLSVLLSPPSTSNDFVQALQKAWRTGSRLSGDSKDLTTMIQTFSGVTLDSGLSPRGVWGNDSGTQKTQKSLSNLVAATVRTTAISEAARTVALLPQPSQSAASLNSGNSTASSINRNVSDIVNVTHPALDADAATSKPADYASWDDLSDIRTALNDAIDKEQLRTTNDTLFLSLTNLRASVNRDIASRLAQVEKTVTHTPKDVLPALVLAAEWFDDASRETDILTRNTVTHPGFVPVEQLRVPVR